jgi:hypothetical protein
MKWFGDCITDGRGRGAGLKSKLALTQRDGSTGRVYVHGEGRHRSPNWRIKPSLLRFSEAGKVSSWQP